MPTRSLQRSIVNIPATCSLAGSSGTDPSREYWAPIQLDPSPALVTAMASPTWRRTRCVRGSGRRRWQAAWNWPQQRYKSTSEVAVAGDLERLPRGACGSGL